MMSELPDPQFEFDFDAPGEQDGMENFRREQQAIRKRIQDVWKVPVGSHVRIQLSWTDRELEGTLVVAEQPARYKRQEPLRLRIGSIQFMHTDIVSCGKCPKDLPG